MQTPPVPRRRDVRRQETIDDIIASATAQLARSGPSGISLRAIARELGMTASAVHYYFPGREALLDAMIVEGFNSLAAVLQASLDGAESLSSVEQWLLVCRAHRGWALEHPADYLLLYSHDSGGATRRGQPAVQQAMLGVVAVLYAVMRRAVATNSIDLERLESAATPHLFAQLTDWRRAGSDLADLPEGALAGCLVLYSQLHGAITLELVGHLPPLIADRAALFDLQMRVTSLALAGRSTSSPVGT